MLNVVHLQCESTRSSTSGGLSWILTISGIWPRLSSPRALGLRLACPKRNQPITSARNSPRGIK